MPTSSKTTGSIAIRCEEIGKRYLIGEQVRRKTLREKIEEAARAPIRWFSSAWYRQGGGENENTELWALRELSLEIRCGEVLGIIGRNGSGKSTFLKILGGITKPTEGRAIISGRIGSLLEVGTGFHSELTGRENIYLNGAILGMTRREIERKFDEIVEFSECGRMLDTPVKHYSSGMYVRLAFAVAAHLETEILLVDEVLAVGDAAFQKKCLGKLGDAAGDGRIVLFVSHNMLAVDNLCTRAICLHEGRVILEGSPGSVTSRYLQHWLPKFKEVVYDDIETAPGNDIVRLRRACVRPQNGVSSDEITVRSPFVVEFEYWILDPNANLIACVQVFNERGISVFTAATIGQPPTPAGLLRRCFFVPADFMNIGTYNVQLFMYFSGTTRITVSWDDIATFEIHDVASELRGDYHGEWPGVVRPRFDWKTEVLEPLPAQLTGTQDRT
ncbi:MAG: ABC transporter ATP-binding protein [Terracidiphilus sp.]